MSVEKRKSIDHVITYATYCLMLVLSIEVFMGLYLYKIKLDYQEEIRQHLINRKLKENRDGQETWMAVNNGEPLEGPTFCETIQHCIPELSTLKRERRQVGEPGPPGYPGIVGLRGMPGFPGRKGLKGNEGVPGGPGDKGDLGDPGLSMVGIPGEKGDMGKPGLNGLPGARGMTGDEGTSFPGRPGEPGDIGRPGHMGQKGFRGSVGFPGDVRHGDKGITGPPGLKGDRGFVGIDGRPGFPGMKGMPGLPGSHGLITLTCQKGNADEEGNSTLALAPSSSSFTCVKGDKGDFGYQGFIGNQGEPGTKGRRGFVGTKGYPGQMGFDGIPGIKGDKGEVGAPGLTCSSCEKDLEDPLIWKASKYGDQDYPELSPRNAECVINSIGEWKAYGFSNTFIQSWMVDSNPPTDADGKKVWVTTNENNILLQLSDILRLMHKKNKNDFNSYDLEQSFHGNDHVVYKGSFFYQAAEGNPRIIKYSLEDETSQELNIPGLTTDNSVPLYSTKHNHLDFSADENGLWVIFGVPGTNNTGVMKVDTDTMTIEYMWNTTINHLNYSEMFIASGILYPIDDTEVDTNKTISLALDLYKQKPIEVNIIINNQFEMLTMATYDHRNKQLLTLDGGVLLSFPVQCEENDSKEVDVPVEEDAGIGTSYT